MRHTFGGDIASYTIDLGTEEITTITSQTGAPAIVVGGQQVTFWDARTGGNQYTDLLKATTGGPDDEGGEAITAVTTSSGAQGDPPLGSIPLFLGPEGGGDDIVYMWAQVGSGDGTGGAESAETVDPVEVDEDGNPIEPAEEDDGGVDPEDEETGTVNAVPGGRLLIVASTAGLQLRESLLALREQVVPALNDLTGRADDADTHLQLHDNQIAELQGRSSSGAGITVGTTAERGTPTLGAMFLDYTTNRLWIGIKAIGSGAPVWAPPPGTVVYQARASTSQPLPDGTPVAIKWTDIDYDLLGGYRGVATAARFVPTVPGWYQLSGAVSFSGNSGASADSVRYVQWRTNNNIVPSAATSAYGTTTGFTSVLPARTFSIYLDGDDDYCELVAYHNADVALSTANTGFAQCGITVTYQGGFGIAG
jgi:hypothetical protein